MGELERYGLLSAALLLLMAGLLAFFGRDSGDDRQGAPSLSANPSTLDRDAGSRSGRDPGAGPKIVKPVTEIAPKPLTTPTENEHDDGDDLEVRPRPANDGSTGAATNPDLAKPPAVTPKVEPAEITPKPPVVEGPIHYKVKAGDTLSSISKLHFGDKKYYPLIQSANPGLNANALKVGQELILPAKNATGDVGTKPAVPADGKVEKPTEIKPKTVAPAKSDAPAKTNKAAPNVEPVSSIKPVKGKASAVTPKETAPAATDKKGVREHRVTKGDTLTSIARRYYDDSNKWKVIFEANRDKLKSTSLVPEGVVLKIP